MIKPFENPKIAVAIPCHNEEASIASVVDEFKKHVPEAVIYVFDNASTDQSAAFAHTAGAVVIPVPRKGKGRVMAAIFDHIKADAVIVVDGDGTYPAEDAHLLLPPVLRGDADMTVGNRLIKENHGSHFYINRLGSQMIVKIINVIFGTSFTDVLSGYRVFSRRFLQSIPLLTPGFETETELTIQALEDGFIIKEIPVGYRPRPHNSPSKLRPLNDGWRIILTIAMLLRDHYPLRLYGAMSLIFYLFSLCIFLNPDDLSSAERYWTAGFLFFLGTIFSGIGFILSAVNTRLREIKQLLLRRN